MQDDHPGHAHMQPQSGHPSSEGEWVVQPSRQRNPLVPSQQHSPECPKPWCPHEGLKMMRYISLYKIKKCNLTLKWAHLPMPHRFHGTLPLQIWPSWLLHCFLCSSCPLHGLLMWLAELQITYSGPKSLLEFKFSCSGSDLIKWYQLLVWHQHILLTYI